MRVHIVRAMLAMFAVGMISLPADGQRRSRSHRSGGEVRVDVRLGARPSVRLIAYDRGYYGSRGRYQVSLRRLSRVAPREFRRALRDHRRLHRDMRRMPHRRAARMHARWHRHTGWSHREFVNVQRW